MSLIESRAVFEGRARHMGLSLRTIESMIRKGFGTLADYAHSSAYVPGAADDRAFIEKVVIPVVGAEDSPEVPALRRLLFEAYTLAAAELRGQLDRQVDDAPRRLPAPERNERYKKLQAALPDIEMVGPYEPAHALVDTFADFLQTGTVKYVPWIECISRDDEVLLIKKEKGLKKDPNTGYVRMVDEAQLPTADIATDLRLVQALTRRGLAMELAGIMGFLVHDKLVKVLIKEYQRQQPEEFGQLSYAHLERADKEVFRRLAEECRAGLQMDAIGVRPMDKALPMVLSEVTFRMLLVPPRAGIKSSASTAVASAAHQVADKGSESVKKSKKECSQEG